MKSEGRDHAERDTLRIPRPQHRLELRHRAQRAHHRDHDEERREDLFSGARLLRMSTGEATTVMQLLVKAEIRKKKQRRTFARVQNKCCSRNWLGLASPN